MNKKQKKNLQRIIIALILVLILKLLPQFPTPVELVLYCIKHNTNLDDLSLAEYKAISPVFDESVYAAINVNECAQARKVIGGPAKEVTTAAIAANKEYFKTI